MRVREAAKLVLKRIQKVGWRQNQAGGPNGPNCLSGAICHAVGCSSGLKRDNENDSGLKHDNEDDIRKAICAALPDRVVGMVQWNDTIGRTQKEVEDLLRSIAYPKKKRKAGPKAQPNPIDS